MAKTEKEDYRGDVSSYEGIVPLWLIIVFVALIIWSIVYFIEHWGGFGPGYQP